MSRKAQSKAVLLALAVASLAAVPVAQAASVAIENPGFENSFEGWTDVDPSAISGSDVYEGAKAAKITGSGGLAEQTVSVQANTNYTLSAYVLDAGIIGVEVDGNNYSTSGGSSDWQKLEVSFNSGSATSVTLYGAYGGATGRFDSFALETSGDVVAATPAPTATPTQEPGICEASSLTIVSATDDGTNDGNGPENTIDGTITDSSRWSSLGSGKSLTLQLNDNYSVTGINLAMFRGEQRNAYFSVETSVDGNSWTTVLSNAQSSGTTSGFESYDLSASTASLVRFTGNGNSANLWNSVIEAEVLGCASGVVVPTVEPTPVPTAEPTAVPTVEPTPTPTPTPVPTVEPTPVPTVAPTAEPSDCVIANVGISSAADDGTNDGHGPANTIDDDLSTESRWSSDGSGKSVIYTLDGGYRVSSIDIAWFKGDQRSSYFSVETSEDGDTWTPVLSDAQSSGSDAGLESYGLAETSAVQVRVTGYGNSANTWNSIVEADVYGCPDDTLVVPTPEPTPVPTVEPTVEPTPQPTVPPTAGGCDIDMTIWGYTVGDGVSRNSQSDIQDLVDNKTLGDDEITWENGCPTFKVANIASTSTSSSFSRSELRELVTEYYDDSPNVKGITKNNWVTSVAPESNQTAAGGVDGRMTATLKVNTVSVDSTKTDQLGRIIVGQIHAGNHEPVKIYYQKLPQFEKGSVYFTVDGSSGSPVNRINVIGFTDKYDRDENASTYEEPENGIALGDEWSYEIEMIGDQLKVTVWHDGKTYTTADSLAYTRTRNKQTIENDSDVNAITLQDFYKDDYMYFKAGVYNQNNTGTSSPNYASVTFYQIDVEHY